MSKQSGAAKVAQNNNGEHPALTSVEDFRALRLHGKVMELETSGRVVHWRPVHLARMLKAGTIPNHLINFVTSLTWAGESKEERSDVEQAIEWQDYLDWISATTLLHPRVVDDPRGADEIAVEDLFYEEQMELDRLARHPINTVKPFRPEQDVAVELGTEGERVEQTAE